MTVAGCGGGTDEPAPVQSTAEMIAHIVQAMPNPGTHDQLANFLPVLSYTFQRNSRTAF